MLTYMRTYAEDLLGSLRSEKGELEEMVQPSGAYADVC
jgi:hypothetical protein